MENENLVHGASVTRWIPTTDEHRAALAPGYDEIVYVAEEDFEDGYSRLKICWRPKQKPKQANADVPTYLTTVVWWVR